MNLSLTDAANMTGRTSREKRRYKRYTIDAIHGSLLHSSDINVIDISLGGAAIETTKRLTINKEYSLTLRYRDSLIKLRGVIAWSSSR